MINSSDAPNDDTAWAIREHSREKARDLADRYDRHAIFMDGREMDQYFSDDMTADEKLAMKRYVVWLGKATWVWPDLR